MRPVLFAALGTSLSLACACCAEVRPTRPQLEREIEYLLRWKAFWDGSNSLRDYRSGKVVEAALVESSNEIAVFLVDVGAAIYFRVEEGQFAGANIQAMSDEKGSEAVTQYLSQKNGKPGFVVKPGTAINNPDFPLRRGQTAQDPKREGAKVDSLRFRLPELQPPDYILTRRPPPELPGFEARVDERVRGFYGGSCGKGEVLIPYFSGRDPTIYVYADLGNCGSGIFPFVRDEAGVWRSGQFSPDKSPNNWSLTIRRIRENYVSKISLPAGPK